MIEKHAKATILAYKKINNSVLLVNDNAFDESCKKTLDKTPCYYMGIKNTPLLKATAEVLKAKNYILHTLDKKALGGRAIDIDLINPLTGRIMTGSSSGTAINVFLGINDIGIGSDGGGSVLAPALSLNLYGFISPIFPVEKVEKKSTDNISFTVSAGIIARELEDLEKIVPLFNRNIINDNNKILFVGINNMNKLKCEQETLDIFKISRQDAINYLIEKFKKYDYIISEEGPIDFETYGDSLIGNMECSEYQTAGKKGFLRVANMINAHALVVPTKKISSGYIIMSKNDNLDKLFEIGKSLKEEIPTLHKKYFHDTLNDLSNSFFE